MSTIIITFSLQAYLFLKEVNQIPILSTSSKVISSPL